MFVIDLLQSFFGRAIQFKFHDINEFISLQDKVNTAFTRMIFHFHVEADQLKNNEKHVFVMQLLVTNDFVGSVRKETLQATEKES